MTPIFDALAAESGYTPSNTADLPLPLFESVKLKPARKTSKGK